MSPHTSLCSLRLGRYHISQLAFVKCSKTWDSGLLRCDAVSLSVGSWHVKGYGAIIFKDRAVLGLPYHDHKHSKCWEPPSTDTALHTRRFDSSATLLWEPWIYLTLCLQCFYTLNINNWTQNFPILQIYISPVTFQVSMVAWGRNKSSEM